MFTKPIQSPNKQISKAAVYRGPLDSKYSLIKSKKNLDSKQSSIPDVVPESKRRAWRGMKLTDVAS